MKIISREMEYTIEPMSDGMWDVTDAGGHRPLGLRDAGPFKTADAAATAILGMSAAEAAE